MLGDHHILILFAFCHSFSFYGHLSLFLGDSLTRRIRARSEPLVSIGFVPFSNDFLMYELHIVAHCMSIQLPFNKMLL